jgi:plastocyanin
MSRANALILAAGLALAAAACTKREEAPPAPASATAPPPAAPAPGAAPTTAAGTSTIKGVVKLNGTPPAAKPIKRETDPYCARKQMNEEDVLVGAGGALKNVIVRISKGVTGHYDPPAQDATLDQLDCMYRPRVQGIMAGQTLVIKNGDQTLHNVHSYKGPSTLFNQAQVPGLPPMGKKFNDSGDIIKFKCDVHPWMTGFVSVTNHPFFAVTGDDGTFSIGKVPPGTYTLEAWHERYGSKTVEITVAADKPTETSFTFDAK